LELPRHVEIEESFGEKRCWGFDDFVAAKGTFKGYPYIFLLKEAFGKI
jgi:hypothetical protein